MAHHSNKKSMQKEALKEYIEVASFCVNFDKSKSESWKSEVGCYGYPGALLLFSIADSIGAVIENNGHESNTEENFKIFNNSDYYDLGLTDDELKILRTSYRNKLSHNSHIKDSVILKIGDSDTDILLKENNKYVLNLKPFLELSKKMVNKFSQEVLKISENSEEQLAEIFDASLHSTPVTGYGGDSNIQEQIIDFKREKEEEDE